MIPVRYLGLILSAAIFGTAAVYAQDSSAPADSTQQHKQLPSQPVPRSSDPDENSSPENPKTVTAPPRDDGESSSRDQIIDLSPPANDVKEHPESEVPDEEVTEFHKWDPHKNELIWHVIYGENTNDPQLQVAVDASSGSYIRKE